MKHHILPFLLLLCAATPTHHSIIQGSAIHNLPRYLSGFRNAQISAIRNHRDFALFFAVNTYQYASSWHNLTNPVSDAREIAKDLEDLYGYRTEVVENPTKTEIFEKLTEYAKRSNLKDGQLLVFFTGHGRFDELSKIGYFVPSDGKSPRDDPYGQSYLTHAELRLRISGIPCKHILLAVDACFSGTIDPVIALKGENEDLDPPNLTEIDRPKEAEFFQKKLIADKLRAKTRLYITSGEKNYTPDPSEFADQFKAGIRTLGGKNGHLDIYTLYYSYLKNVKSKPQLGSFEGNEPGANFIFEYNNAKKNSGTVLMPPTADRDADGIPDARDGCPTEWANTQSGCPDGDEDGVPDKDDACPYEKGTAARSGCPSPSDRDGDGVPDIGDQCPDTKGLAKYQGCPDSDGDGVPDHKDECPDQIGPAADKGCPAPKMADTPADSDDDGVPDVRDQCPKVKGLAKYQGCPDSDGDGVPDNKDNCPNETGTEADKGCPAPKTVDVPTDRDGDGVADVADQCPDVKGLTQYQGCPDTDSDGVSDNKDNCPNEKGNPLKNGCPEILSYLEDLRRADKQFDLYAFNLALRTYKQVLNQQPDNAHALARTGDCYFQLNRPKEALSWYDQAVIQSNVELEVLLRYGKALMQTGDYSAAKKWLTLYASRDQAVSQHFVQMCDFALQTTQKGDLFQAANEPLNTDAADYAPAFYGTKIVYNSARTDILRKSTARTNGDWNGSAYNQLFITQGNVGDNSLQKPTFLHNDLQNNFNEGPVSFSADGRRVAFCRNNFINGTRQIAEKGVNMSLYIADVINDDWVNVRAFPFNGEDFATGFPFLTEDGNTLIFASNNPASTTGGKGWDIYVSTLKNNVWSSPRNLGAPLNTIGNEITPFYDGTYLYFSSDWHLGLGGFDVFYVELGNNTTTKVVHLGPAINSSYDDYGFIYQPNQNMGYLTSTRLGGKGNEDIWKIQKMQAPSISKPTYYQEHFVRQGDTLNSIAVKYKVNAKELAIINNKEINETLIAGQRLLIPRN